MPAPTFALAFGPAFAPVLLFCFDRLLMDESEFVLFERELILLVVNCMVLLKRPPVTFLGCS